ATVVDFTRFQPVTEAERYPNAGDPNPVAKFAIASAESGEVKWVDLSAYAKDKGFIISRVGWLPDGKTAWFCVMNRTQTWMDFCTVGLEGGDPTKLLRDTTKAWVEYPKPPVFLADGTFLFQSERTGWRHIYHHGKDGKELAAVTKGDWE